MSKFKQFATMPLSPQMHQAIDAMGFTTPTAIQEIVLPHGLKHRDILGQAQTGTGKTLAFSIPIIELANKKARYVQAIILTPTRELARQLKTVLREKANERLLSAMKRIISTAKLILPLKNGMDLSQMTNTDFNSCLACLEPPISATSIFMTLSTDIA